MGQFKYMKFYSNRLYNFSTRDILPEGKVLIGKAVEKVATLDDKGSLDVLYVALVYLLEKVDIDTGLCRGRNR